MTYCDVCWGSHACVLGRGHTGPCLCDCAIKPMEKGVLNVGGPPYYGLETRFYGKDATPAKIAYLQGVIRVA